MPPINSVLERIYQPLWSGWRISREKDPEKQLLLETMNLFVSDLGNNIKTNMRTCASLVADRSALVHRFGVFASFDNMEDYVEFWGKCSCDFIMNGRTFHHLEMKDVEIPETHDRFESDKTFLPSPTHEYGYFGWFTLELPLQVAPRAEMFVRLYSSKKLVQSMKEQWYMPHDEFSAITVFLDTEALREVM